MLVAVLLIGLISCGEKKPKIVVHDTTPEWKRNFEDSNNINWKTHFDTINIRH